MCAIPAASPSPSVRTLGGEVCSSCTVRSSETQSYTESALKELYQQVSSMPESAKKKKLIRQVRLDSVIPCECKHGAKEHTDELHAAQHQLVLYFCLQFEKQHLQTPSAESRSPFSRKHWRSRSLGGIIKVSWQYACVQFFFFFLITSDTIEQYFYDMRKEIQWTCWWEV